jgi:hypothetical protein
MKRVMGKVSTIFNSLLWLLVQNETLIQRSAEQEETRELQEMKLQ